LPQWFAAALTDLNELKAARLRGELVEASAVEAEWSDVLRIVRAGMLALPSRVAARLSHLSKHDVAEVDAEIRAVLAKDLPVTTGRLRPRGDERTGARNKIVRMALDRGRVARHIGPHLDYDHFPAVRRLLSPRGCGKMDIGDGAGTWH